MTITKRQIEKAKEKLNLRNPHHEDDVCIRIAYEWLDAQKKIESFTRERISLKHLIESWGGRYVSQSDVEVAAELHPLIRGDYPHYNISARLTYPCIERLKGIREMFTQSYIEQNQGENYSEIEKYR